MLPIMILYRTTRLIMILQALSPLPLSLVMVRYLVSLITVKILLILRHLVAQFLVVGLVVVARITQLVVLLWRLRMWLVQQR